MTRVLAFTAALVAAGSAVAGDDIQPSPLPPTQDVVAGQRYHAGSMHRFFLGPGYRTTWTTPLRVPVLDLGAYGGLQPTRLGGGKQTLSLRFRSGDGRRFRFRSVDKDTSRVIPADLRDTAAEWLIQDQIGASYPVAAPMVDHLRGALGMHFVPRTLYVMPDDERLGEFREQFKGMLGTLEENPRLEPPVTPGFEGATEMIETGELLKRLDASSEESIDVRAYLRHRMLDFVIGDWDRHQGQWEWVKRSDHTEWLPFVDDTDMAFSTYDGLLPSLVRRSLPSLVTFDAAHTDVLGLMWNSRELDRRFLSEQGRDAYMEAAAWARRELTDAVIEAAVRQLPPEYYAVDGAHLTTALKRRRDRLGDFARRFYELLARVVEVHATDQADTAEIDRGERGATEVRLSGPGRSEPYYRRRFLPVETDEVRLFLKGGDDRAVARGGAGGIEVRVIGGPGDDVLDDARGGGTQLFDHEGRNRVVRGRGTRFDERPYEHPLDSRDYRRLDWGGFTFVMPIVGYDADVGFVAGVRADFIRHGFRNHPWASRHLIGAAYAFGRTAPKVEYDGQWQSTNSTRRLRVLARASDMEVVHFHGFGNDMPAPGPDEFYRTDLRQVVLQPSFRFGFQRLDLWVGPRLKYHETRFDEPTFLELTQPYGVGDFGQAGLNLTLAADTRERPDGLGRGIRVAAEGSYYPGVWSVEEGFGEVHGEVAGYLRFLALRVGGRKVWGTYPFHEAAYLGGAQTLRGTRRERYAGDAAVFGSAELRIPLFRFNLFMPVRAGIFGLADAGRVYLDGESPGGWHKGLGGGAWFSFIKPENTLSIAAAVDPDAEGDDRGTRLYIQGGFGF